MNFKKMNGRTGAIIIICFVIILIYIQTKIRNHIYKNYGHYTIGTTIYKYLTPVSGSYIRYSYKVRNIYYEKDAPYTNAYPKYPGGRYYVEFNNNKPSMSKLLENKPVPDSIKEAPPDGWSKIPGE
jgi:hypothetical protein